MIFLQLIFVFICQLLATLFVPDFDLMTFAVGAAVGAFGVFFSVVAKRIRK